MVFGGESRNKNGSKERLRCKSSEVTKVAIKELINSNADVVIIPIQDLLGLGSSARINTPVTVTKDNWSWTAPDDWIIDPLLGLDVRIGEVFRPHGVVQ